MFEMLNLINNIHHVQLILNDVVVQLDVLNVNVNDVIDKDDE
jgi:hypothetical protein